MNLYLTHDIPPEASMSEESFPFQVHGAARTAALAALPVRHCELGVDNARS